MKSFFLILVLGLTVSCQKDSGRTLDTNYNPDVSLAKFANSLKLTNKYFVFEAGKTYIYESQTKEGKTRIESSRLATIKTIVGISCFIIEVQEYLNDKLIESTHDWFAQDNSGNVWYFGEYVNNYDVAGKLTDHNGSWEAGIEGAKAGIIMLENPQLGMKYRQEYYFNEAEDEAEVIGIGESVASPLFSNVSNCIKTKEFTALEPKALEYKYYAPGVGLIKITNVTDKYDTFLTKIK